MQVASLALFFSCGAGAPTVHLAWNKFVAQGRQVVSNKCAHAGMLFHADILVFGVLLLCETQVGQLLVVVKGSNLLNLFLWLVLSCGRYHPLPSPGAWYMACNYLPVQGGYAALQRRTGKAANASPGTFIFFYVRSLWRSFCHRAHFLSQL